MKKVLSIMVCLLLCLQFSVIACAEEYSAEDISEKLYSLGLVKGAGTDEYGNIDFELDRQATRTEGVIMLIRLLGCENEALVSGASHPFTDVPLWAENYISYAYNSGLTKGISESKFGSEEIISDKMYITFILRANGYSDLNNEDFSWDNPYELSNSLGITHISNNEKFLRSDMMLLSYTALFAEGKDGRKLYESLVSKKVFTKEQFQEICNIDGEMNTNKEDPVKETAKCEHNISVTPSIKATCSEVGYTEEKYCSICGEVLQRRKQLAKTEHIFDEWKIEKEATNLSDGTKIRVCTNCNHVERVNYKTNIVVPERISINSSITIDKNDVITIIPTLTPKNSYSKYIWESSDESIAKVNSAGNGTSGNVTGVSAGDAIITVYTENGLSATCAVKVKDTSSASSLSVNKTITLDKGAQKDLTINLTPANSKALYSAESSDESIASVSTTGGRTGVRVRGVSAGRTEVTVYTDDGLSATCTIIVNGAPDPTSITIPEKHIMDGGETWDVPISIEPNGISTVYSIKTSDAEIVKVGTTGGRTGCRVTAYSPGTAIITIYTENGLSATCEITVR